MIREDEIRAALRRKHELLDDAQEHSTIIRLERQIDDLQAELASLKEPRNDT